MRLVTCVGKGFSVPSSLSWPEPTSLLALSDLLQEPLTSEPHHTLPFYKGCKAYEDGWSKLDDTPLTLLPPPNQQPLSLTTATQEQRGGIEKLVDELCAKLKQIQDVESEAPQTPRPNFALVLKDMHDAHYSGYPSLGAECRVVDFTSNADSWCNDSDMKNDLWLTSNWARPYGDNNKDEGLLCEFTENQQNVLTSLDDKEIDLFLDAPTNDDPSLARLIAKFDSTVEALWSPDSMVLEDKSPQVEPQVFISSGTNLTSSIWSDTSNNEHTVNISQIVGSKTWTEQKDPEDQTAIKNAWNTANSNSSWQIGYGLGLLSQTILDGENELQQNSLNLINHNREKSGFTEVRKTNSAKTSWSTDQATSKPINVATTIEISTEYCQEEEDLLTSAKTHFRPIKQNSLEQNISSSQDTVRYEDGTTFAISSSLDKPPFIRSSSGCLYLNASDSPKKYMLYTEKEPYNGKYNTGGFIPKFAVRKSEKGIQTDRDTEDSDSEEDKGFYFPGDEGQFTDNIDCPADIEDEGDDDSDVNSDSDDSNWRTKLEKSWGGEEHNNIPSWCDAKWRDGVERGGNVNMGQSGGEAAWFRHLWRCEEDEGEQTKPSSARLRAELSAEGEQLFADIQYLQTLFLRDCWATPAVVAVARRNSDDDADTTSEDSVKGSTRCSKSPLVSALSSHKVQQQQREHAQQSERTYDKITVAPATFLTRTTIPQSVWEEHENTGTALTQPGL